MASPPADAPDLWTTRRLLRWMTARFAGEGVDHPRRVAEMLLAHVLGVDRMRLYMDADRPASPEERTRLRDLVARAQRHEPIDYLVGEAPFYMLSFEVGPDVLVPRPSTETLVETLLHDATARRRTSRDDRGEAGETVPETEDDADDGVAPPMPVRVADIGCGSGAIAVVVAARLPHASVDAVDLSGDRITFHEGDLLQPLAGRRYDYLASNPPYIPDDEWDRVDANVREHEPTLALRGGPDGLAVIRPLLASAPDHVLPGGMLLLETAASHAETVAGLARASPAWAQVQVRRDHEDLPRVITARRR